MLGLGYTVAHGGKGGNQAVAAARAGGDVLMVGAVGEDSNGKAALDELRESGVDVSGTRKIAGARTGAAFVAVDDQGANQILVVPAANFHLSAGWVEAQVGAGAQSSSPVVLVSLEIPDEAVEAAVRAGREAGATVILNPAPYRPVPPAVISQIDVITPNEVEFRQLVGAPADAGLHHETIRIWVAEAQEFPASLTWVITLGAAGAVTFVGGDTVAVPAPQVGAVDTTGAGDAFNGALATAIAGGTKLAVSVARAVDAASTSVTHVGARMGVTNTTPNEHYDPGSDRDS